MSMTWSCAFHSAGVGRTGTFIGIWNLCHKDIHVLSNSVNIKQEVLAMRRNRCNMVQTKVNNHLSIKHYFMIYHNFIMIRLHVLNVYYIYYNGAYHRTLQEQYLYLFECFSAYVKTPKRWPLPEYGGSLIKQ